MQVNSCQQTILFTGSFCSLYYLAQVWATLKKKTNYLIVSSTLEKEKEAVSGKTQISFPFSSIHSCRLFLFAFRSVSELLSEKSWVNIMDEKRTSYFPTKQISLVTKLVLLTKNTFCYIQNIIMCTVLEFLEEFRVFFAVGEASWQAKCSNCPSVLQWGGS